jgi:hypothetical protein
MRGGICVVTMDVIFDRITMQNPANLVYCYTTPHIRLVFLNKNQVFGHVSNILQNYKNVTVLGLHFLLRYMCCSSAVHIYFYYAVQHVSQAPPGRAKCPADHA